LRFFVNRSSWEGSKWQLANGNWQNQLQRLNHKGHRKTAIGKNNSKSFNHKGHEGNTKEQQKQKYTTEQQKQKTTRANRNFKLTSIYLQAEKSEGSKWDGS
jgi:hypothetical protein